MSSDTTWSGLCPAGRHGLDYSGQVCDLCPSTFAVWPKDGSDVARTYSAPDVRIAAELRARDDARAGVEVATATTAYWPITYCARDDRTGQFWLVVVDLVHRPSFTAIDTREVEMAAATHVLWGGRVLCEDLRLCGVPRVWPADQRWISLKDVADGHAAPPDACEACWKKAPGARHGPAADLGESMKLDLHLVPGANR